MQRLWVGSNGLECRVVAKIHLERVWDAYLGRRLQLGAVGVGEGKDKHGFTQPLSEGTRIAQSSVIL